MGIQVEPVVGSVERKKSKIRGVPPSSVCACEEKCEKDVGAESVKPWDPSERRKDWSDVLAFWLGEVESKLKSSQMIKLGNNGRKESSNERIVENCGCLDAARLAKWRFNIAESPNLTRSPQGWDQRMVGGV